MNQFLFLLLALQIPIFFLFAVSVFFLGRRAPSSWLPKLLALEFPVLAAGGLGLPLWALLRILQG